MGSDATTAQTAADTVSGEQKQEDLNVLLEPDATVQDTVAGEAGDKVQDTAQSQASDDQVRDAAAVNQPGTSDKLLQKMQQEVAAIAKTHELVLQRLERGEAITEKQRQQVVEAPRKIELLQKAIKERGGFDAFEHGDVLVEALQEIEQEAGELRGVTAKQAEVIDQLQEQIVFNQLADTYKGVNVRNCGRSPRKTPNRTNALAMKLGSNGLMNSSTHGQTRRPRA